MSEKHIAIFRSLAQDTNLTTRANIARYTGTPQEVLDGMKDDPSLCVRVALAGNCQISSATRAHLEKDHSLAVRETLKRTFAKKLNLNALQFAGHFFMD